MSVSFVLVSLAHWLPRAEVLYPTFLDRSSKCKNAVPDTWAPHALCRSAAHRTEIQDGGGRRSAETLLGALHSTRSMSSIPAPDQQDLVLLLAQSVQLLSSVQLFATPRVIAGQASLSITNSWSLLKFKSIKSVMPSNHLILFHPFLLLPSVFPSITVFSNQYALCNRWPKYWSFSFSVSPSNEF